MKFVKKYPGRIRPKYYYYQNFWLHNISKNKIKTSIWQKMEMNNLDVHILLEIEKREEHNYRIFKFPDSEVEDLSSSYRELLVLHDSIKSTDCCVLVRLLNGI